MYFFVSALCIRFPSHLILTELVTQIFDGVQITRMVHLVYRTLKIQGGSNMTGTDCGLFTHNQSRSYLNHLVLQNLFILVLHWFVSFSVFLLPGPWQITSISFYFASPISCCLSPNVVFFFCNTGMLSVL